MAHTGCLFVQYQIKRVLSQPPAIGLLIQARNRMDQEPSGAEPNMEGLIQSYELAFRMQVQAPEVFGVMRESEATRNLYALWRPVL